MKSKEVFIVVDVGSKCLHFVVGFIRVAMD